MYRIKTMNKISPKGLAHLDAARFDVGDSLAQEQAILVRSAKLHDYNFPSELLAIARAGAGVNNIPLDRCSEAGIVVFNTPGANANAVKELAICALLLASRNISGGIAWVKEQAKTGADVAQAVEKGKAAFAGQEIMGKTLGIVGLGAIGILVANAAVALGMQVVGYDPFLSVTSALSLSPGIKYVQDLQKLYAASDYISLHLPMTSETRASVNQAAFAQMKDGVRIINLARGELVHNGDMIAALESGKVSSYVTDFPDGEISHAAGVVPIPHLGASTEESEENCAVMAAMQLKDYLEQGNIKNSVNLPNLSQEWQTASRLSILYRHHPDTLTEITSKLSQNGIGAESLSSKTRGEYAYTLLDTNASMDASVISALQSTNGVLRVRVLKQ